MNQNLQDWLALSSVPGLGPATFSSLLNQFHAPTRVLHAKPGQLSRVPYVGKEIARAICNQRDTSWPRDQIMRALDANVRIITLSDPDFPAYLKQIYAPPPILYVRGEIDICSRPAVAIVGSRSFTSYGKDSAYRMANELASRGITVVSGMATGIDTYAHRGALLADGYTAAVLGSGLDHPYPAENLGLFRDICETGAAISEFPMGTKAEAHNFPRRNRIISGLSLGVLVVEAGDRSGALITSRLALEQNREVFAIPGPIHSGRSIGTNRLLKQGAVLVETVEDILSEIGAHLAPTTRTGKARLVEDLTETLSGDEKKVYVCLSDVEPVHIDAIEQETGLSGTAILTSLLSLELSNHVEQKAGKLFRRKYPTSTRSGQ